MADRLERTSPSRSTAFRVGDCYIWSEINYLDSSTNYREFLPANEKSRAGADDLVMLDSSQVCWPRVVGLLTVLLAGVVGAGWLVYLALTGY